jgi:hypothetical protein
MSFLVFAAIVVASCVSDVATAFQPPAFCHGINCPKFTTVLNCSEYEIRHYPAQQWVSFSTQGVSAEDFTDATQDGFNHLFDYISGANQGNTSIDMTAPVAVDVTPGAGPNCNSTFRVSFYVPYIYQGIAPAPTDPTVSLFIRPEQYIAVRSFPGFVVDWTLSIVPELLALGTSLDKRGVTYNTTYETVSQYDGPFTIFNRHNEVWLDVDRSSIPKQC